MRRTVLLLVLVAFATTAAAQSHVNRWRTSVDAYWEPALTVEQQLHVFDKYWGTADSSFAAFHNLDVDWPAMRERYRPEIEAGASRGRFAGIMNHLALALREQHSFTTDSLVNRGTPPQHGTPLMQLGGWWTETRFGACLTLTPDSTLVVYDAVPDHPLDLAPGDAVLGYDGLRWQEAYRMMLAADLPIMEGDLAKGRNSSWGSAPSAFDHSLMIAAGRNWHLFDEIDVVRHGSADTLRLPVMPLKALDDSLLCMEQLPMPGVEMPNLDRSEFISWGIVDGTRIGYVYVWSWWNDPGSSYWIPGAPQIDESFEQAVRELALDQATDGIIFDFRTNRGGLAHYSNPGFSILFDELVPTLAVDERSDPSDHFAMKKGRGIPMLDVPGDPATFYDHPIAVLTGPGAFSAGDYTPVRLAHHPRARVFGKSTAAGFSPANPVRFDAPGWVGRVSFLEAYRKSEPGRYLTHTEQHVDEPVWHSRQAVAQGRDRVVEAALDWITHVIADADAVAEARPTSLHQNYPNPASHATVIEVYLAAGTDASLHVHDLLGRKVMAVVDGQLPPGRHRFEIDAGRLAAGMYIYTMRAGDFSDTKAMHVVH